MKKHFVRFIALLVIIQISTQLFGQANNSLQNRTSTYQLSQGNLFYISDNEILSKVLDAVMDGRITAYQDQALLKAMPTNQLLANIGKAWNLQGVEWDSYAAKAQGTLRVSIFLTVTGDLDEDVSYQINSIALVLPKEYSKSGQEDEIGHFNFEEVTYLYASQAVALQFTDKILSKNGLLDFQKLQLIPSAKPEQSMEAMAISH